MVVFRRRKDNFCLAADRYPPTFFIEMFKVGPNFRKLKEREEWRLIFIIMMVSCPEEVRVEFELRENAIKELLSLRPEIQIYIDEMEKHKWIESEKAGYDLGGNVLIEWILRYCPRTGFASKTHKSLNKTFFTRKN
ncbi:MAG: hypothetical protein D8M57_09130 [Candidatus Scalindua sp. AMX11]|nr:MAG: hypothetical protein DWQ00_00640 [Candidatus Scalindua sp.]NOG83044.1 hypothetical protein [Planctomycetota bacterium]RZV79556.1 MAG: hypothetical protein EX341_11005 [Candidatus Scalindua sp. SCAELEC01]TDE65195.1 MAG: hypothetical protein D8M57_09130 [Candidatus Scalindua sp. AMX11]GJQ58568.1 MAG: hypothetical protein SCALA701_13690 [Candidatus Scalindua sp.]